MCCCVYIIVTSLKGIDHSLSVKSHLNQGLYLLLGGRWRRVNCGVWGKRETFSKTEYSITSLLQGCSPTFDSMGDLVYKCFKYYSTKDVIGATGYVSSSEEMKTFKPYMNTNAQLINI